MVVRRSIPPWTAKQRLAAVVPVASAVVAEAAPVDPVAQAEAVGADQALADLLAQLVGLRVGLVDLLPVAPVALRLHVPQPRVLLSHRWR